MASLVSLSLGPWFRTARRRPAACGLALSAALLVFGCSKPRPSPDSTTQPTYDKRTGKLTELTYDRNHNGKIDTWTDMNGAKPLRSRIDLDENGTIDRWEYYDGKGQLLKVGYSRSNGAKPDAWAFAGPDGAVARVEISSVADEQKIDRREFYEATVLVRAEDDTNHDGRPDKWETYENGAVKTAAFDENGDGKPDRRLTYTDGELTLIETEPDASGSYTKKVAVDK
jgi:hypothetical protein